ncbi:MAG: hypothetical protein U1E53_03055 [Dongiaceae bacterium]
MHAALVEAVPAAGQGPLAEALEERLPIVADDVVLAGNVVGLEAGAADDLRGGVDCAGLERCETSPVCSIIAGRFGSPAMRSSAAFRVACGSGLASLVKPMWLSLICTKVRPSAGAAAIASPIPSGRGTPPETRQSRPVPAQARHCSARRRLRLAWGGLVCPSCVSCCGVGDA